MSENKTNKIESRIYMLNELLEEIGKGIQNLHKVIEQEDDLLEVLHKTEVKTKTNFKEFIKGIEDQLNNYDKQLLDLDEKQNNLERFLSLYDKHKDKEEVELMINLLLDVLLKR